MRAARRRREKGQAQTLEEQQAQAYSRATKPAPWAADLADPGGGQTGGSDRLEGVEGEVLPLTQEEQDGARAILSSLRRRRKHGLPLFGPEARARIAALTDEAVQRRAHRRQRERRRAMLAERRMAARQHGVEALFASSDEEDAESLASTSEEEEDRLEGMLARKEAAGVLQGLDDE